MVKFLHRLLSKQIISCNVLLLFYEVLKPYCNNVLFYFKGPSNLPINHCKKDSIEDTIDEARKRQDTTMAILGLFRFKIPEDGNCLFRAVAEGLGLKQESHTQLRNEAHKWMVANANMLIENGLIDNLEELKKSAEIGFWCGSEALTALANVRKLNIAVVLGGDEGQMHIEHFKPLDEATASIKLAYLYNGHYDTIVMDKNKKNEVYEQWQLENKEMLQSDELFAESLSSTTRPKQMLGWHYSYIYFIHLS